jgi:hypothetical protein
MSETSETPNGEMMMVKLPTTTLQFIQRNSNIAKMIGIILVKRQEIVEVLKEADAILADPNAWELAIEDGSKEELEVFLSEIRKAIIEGDIVFKGGLSDEEIEEITNQSAVNTEIEIV